MPDVHVLNLGAGVQSTRLLLENKYDVAIFADTQEEPEAVYSHVEWLEGVSKTPILKRSRGRLGDDLLGETSRGRPFPYREHQKHRFASIPAFTAKVEGTKSGITRRQCSKEYKLEVIERTIRREVLGLKPRQRMPKGVRVHQYFGITLDEVSRASRIYEQFVPHFQFVEKQQTRANCIDWLSDKVPHETPRSACVFCPFHTDAEWQRLKTAGGADWARAVEIDEGLRQPGARANQGLDQSLYLHASCKPLVQIDFKPRANPKELQLGFGVECEGVCGV